MIHKKRLFFSIDGRQFAIVTASICMLTDATSGGSAKKRNDRQKVLRFISHYQTRRVRFP